MIFWEQFDFLVLLKSDYFKQLLESEYLETFSY